ncbi:hypothetical protein [Solitalea koreensis]|uniref:Uncharacterized protein n=1 Tax=Solitalea koreensis TaxID=543615 RepID=A0A521EI13_9SPHI|nr:hypothetical protein [Solitalea koreensis]SMO83567.1 hypothetical protein SAMN06265350_11515 [Solitalea koreensis]
MFLEKRFYYLMAWMVFAVIAYAWTQKVENPDAFHYAQYEQTELRQKLSDTKSDTLTYGYSIKTNH